METIRDHLITKSTDNDNSVECCDEAYAFEHVPKNSQKFLEAIEGFRKWPSDLAEIYIQFNDGEPARWRTALICESCENYILWQRINRLEERLKLLP